MGEVIDGGFSDEYWRVCCEECGRSMEVWINRHGDWLWSCPEHGDVDEGEE